MELLTVRLTMRESEWWTVSMTGQMMACQSEWERACSMGQLTVRLRVRRLRVRKRGGWMEMEMATGQPTGWKKARQMALQRARPMELLMAMLKA